MVGPEPIPFRTPKVEMPSRISKPSLPIVKLPEKKPPETGIRTLDPKTAVPVARFIQNNLPLEKLPETARAIKAILAAGEAKEVRAFKMG